MTQEYRDDFVDPLTPDERKTAAEFVDGVCLRDQWGEMVCNPTFFFAGWNITECDFEEYPMEDNDILQAEITAVDPSGNVFRFTPRIKCDWLTDIVEKYAPTALLAECFDQVLEQDDNPQPLTGCKVSKSETHQFDQSWQEASSFLRSRKSPTPSND